MNRPTAEQAAEFHQYVLHWQDELNLRHWRIEQSSKRAQSGAMADIQCNGSARLAIYRLGDWSGEEITSDSLSRTALHEVLHIFLFDLIDQARDPRTPDCTLEATEHSVINVLEDLLWRKS